MFKYKNHYVMKQNRIIKLKEVNYICELCGGKAKYVHHKDFSYTNHNVSNFLAVCSACHMMIHNVELYNRRIEKFKSMYLSAKERYRKTKILLSEYKFMRRKQKKEKISFLNGYWNRKWKRYYRRKYYEYKQSQNNF